MVSLNTIKNWYKTGLKPTELQFWDTWDSFWHKEDNIPVDKIEGIDNLLNQKANKSVVDSHLTDENAHASLFANKVDKQEGKGLSTEDYTTEEKQKLAEITNDNNFPSIINIDNKVGVNNNAPEAVLDIKNPSPVETQLTGTFSFDGFTLTGNGTLMLSQLHSRTKITVNSTGRTYSVDSVISDTVAIIITGGENFENESCTVTEINKKILNINDFFEVGYDGYGEPQILFKAKVLSQNGNVEIQTENIERFQNNFGPEGGQMGASYSFPRGYPKLSFIISKLNDDLYWSRISNSMGDRHIGFSENGEIRYVGAPNANGDATYTKQVVAKPDGTFGFVDVLEQKTYNIATVFGDTSVKITKTGKQVTFNFNRWVTMAELTTAFNGNTNNPITLCTLPGELRHNMDVNDLRHSMLCRLNTCLIIFSKNDGKVLIYPVSSGVISGSVISENAHFNINITYQVN